MSEWFAFSDYSWIIFDFNSIEYTIYGIGVKSANDDLGHDPESVTISVFVDDSWLEVGRFETNWDYRY